MTSALSACLSEIESRLAETRRLTALYPDVNDFGDLLAERERTLLRDKATLRLATALSRTTYSILEAVVAPLFAEYSANSATPAACPHGDPACPCPDGLTCHYEGPGAWPSANSATRTACWCGQPSDTERVHRSNACEPWITPPAPVSEDRPPDVPEDVWEWVCDTYDAEGQKLWLRTWRSTDQARDRLTLIARSDARSEPGPVTPEPTAPVLCEECGSALPSHFRGCPAPRPTAPEAEQCTRRPGHDEECENWYAQTGGTDG